MLTVFVRTAGPFPPERSRSIPSRTCRIVACCSSSRSATSMPGIGLPYSTQSHISCPEPNAGLSAVLSILTSFSPASGASRGRWSTVASNRGALSRGLRRPALAIALIRDGVAFWRECDATVAPGATVDDLPLTVLGDSVELATESWGRARATGVRFGAKHSHPGMHRFASKLPPPTRPAVCI